MLRVYRFVVLWTCLVAPGLALAAETGMRLPAAHSSPRLFAIGELQTNSDETEHAPPYVLLDDDSRVLCLVTPRPEVDLDRHIGSEVGILGRRQSSKGSQKLHLRAERIRAFRGEADRRVEPAAHSEEATEAVADRPRQPERIANPDSASLSAPARPHATSLMPPPGYGVTAPCSCGAYRSCAGGGGCRYRHRHLVWARGEYLLWWLQGMDVPPLVTTGPTGILGQPGTAVLFGNSTINDGEQSGGRLRIGTWFDCCQSIGAEGEYLGLGTASSQFSSGSNGDPLLAVPFIDAQTGREDAFLVAAVAAGHQGNVSVGGESDFHSAGLRLRLNLCCEHYCGPLFFGSGAATRVSRRLDLLIGYRFLQLDENLGLLVNTTVPMGAFNVRDSFHTKNDFHGAEIGTLWEWSAARWSLELLGKLALGGSQQRVRIDGSTVITPPLGAVATLPGGLFALRSNIGDYRRSEFAVVPELGATIGFRLTDRLRATLGYTFIYFSRVVRPGEQIDRSVNPDLLPPEAVPVSGPLRPVFAFNDTAFWAQGVNVGLDYRW